MTGSPPPVSRSDHENQSTSGPRSARTVVTVLLAIALLVAAGMAMRQSTTRPDRDRAEQLASELSCPSCQGESVANSGSQVAASMRSVIAEQLAAGRTPAQIRAWFVERYGPQVLLDPPKRGLGLLLWFVPAAVLGIALIATSRRLWPRLGGRWFSGPGPTQPDPTQPGPDVAVSSSAGRTDVSRRRPRTRGSPQRRQRVWNLFTAALVAMVALMALLAPRTSGTADNRQDRGGASPSAVGTDPVATALTVGSSLEGQGRFGEAVDVYRDALRQRPDDQIRIRLAYALLRAGRPAEAADTVKQVLAADPASADALLVLGLAQRAMQSAEATQTLRTFLQQAPDHPAAPGVRRLLDGG